MRMLIKFSKLKILARGEDRRKRQNSRRGFTLIELMVAMFIFVLLMGAMVAVSVSGFQSYVKSKAIKTVMEDVGFAINSITKDVRMGKIEKFTVGGASNSGDGINPKDYFAVTLNRNQTVVCYHVTSNYLGVATGTSGSVGPPIMLPTCPSDTGSNYNKIVDLSNTGGIVVDTATSGFISLPTDTETVITPGKNRGWAEINLNITGTSMETDSISVQTIVSSRDYGWEKTP